MVVLHVCFLPGFDFLCKWSPAVCVPVCLPSLAQLVWEVHPGCVSSGVCVSFLYALLSEDTALVVIKESDAQQSARARALPVPKGKSARPHYATGGTGGDTSEKEDHDGRQRRSTRHGPKAVWVPVWLPGPASQSPQRRGEVLLANSRSQAEKPGRVMRDVGRELRCLYLDVMLGQCFS